MMVVNFHYLLMLSSCLQSLDTQKYTTSLQLSLYFVSLLHANKTTIIFPLMFLSLCYSRIRITWSANDKIEDTI